MVIDQIWIQKTTVEIIIKRRNKILTLNIPIEFEDHVVYGEDEDWPKEKEEQIMRPENEERIEEVRSKINEKLKK